MQEEKNIHNFGLDDEPLNIREEVEKYSYYWKWFLLSVLISLIVSYVYLRYAPNEYEVATTILINDEDNGGLASELSVLKDLNMLSGTGGSSIENEIEILKSRTLLERVVTDLSLNVKFYREGRVKTSELFQNSNPIKLNFFSKDSVFYKLDTTFSIKFTSQSQFQLISSEGKRISEHNLGESINSEFGNFTITPTKPANNLNKTEIVIKISPLQVVIDKYRRALQVILVERNASVLQLKLKDELKEKGVAILDNLVYQYNKDAVEDKSLIAKNTDAFLTNRLEIISEDLSSVDKSVENFKSSNNLTDIGSEAALVLESNVDLEKKILDLSTQINIANFVIDHLANNPNDLIPANLGLPDEGVNESSSMYNELILERNRILKSSSKINPVILNLNSQITQVKGSIQQSLVNLKNTLSISLRSLKGQEAVLNSKISKVPKQEREYRDIQRQQKIVETLYLYLLQKREENAITLAATQPNAKIIDKAYGSDIPIAPKRKIIYLAALLLGLIIPFVVLYIIFLLDNKIHTRKDIESVLKTPILGDIPTSEKVNKIVISDQDRSSIAEAFRLLRTNLNFMFSKVKENTKTIYLTSTISGEGKTFVAINLASVLAISNKKVLLIGADVRKPKIFDYIKSTKLKGLTHYLMDEAVQYSDIIENVSEYGFDVIHSGIIPPNPAELLMSSRFEELISYGKKQYDYVIVDTTPINLVTDTLLISHFADLFIYVIRANYLDKRLLEIPKIMYQDKRLPNMAILINGTNFEKGYGYGYGYGYGEKKKRKNWLEIIKSKF